MRYQETAEYKNRRALLVANGWEPANEHDCPECTLSTHPNYMPEPDGEIPDRCVDDEDAEAIIRFAEAAVAAALEKAAVVADDYDGDGQDHDMYTQLGDSAKTASDIAKAIRQMKGDQEDGG